MTQPTDKPDDLTELALLELLREWRGPYPFSDGYDHHVTAWRGWMFLQALADSYWPEERGPLC
jgi:hypothetical protein